MWREIIIFEFESLLKISMPIHSVFKGVAWGLGGGDKKGKKWEMSLIQSTILKKNSFMEW